MRIPMDLSGSFFLKGSSFEGILNKAVDRIQAEDGWIERCMQALSIEMPKALLWQKIRSITPRQ